MGHMSCIRLTKKIGLFLPIRFCSVAMRGVAMRGSPLLQVFTYSQLSYGLQKDLGSILKSPNRIISESVHEEKNEAK